MKMASTLLLELSHKTCAVPSVVAYGLFILATISVFDTKRFSTLFPLLLLGFTHTTTMVVAIQSCKFFEASNF